MFWQKHLSVKSVLVHIPVTVINTVIKGNLERKNFISYYISRLKSIIEGSQAGTWKEEQKRKPWRILFL